MEPMTTLTSIEGRDPGDKAWDMKLIAEEYILTNARAEGSQKLLKMIAILKGFRAIRV